MPDCFSKKNISLFHGDNRAVLNGFADETFHAIVTDPPYELGFMGKKWDSSGIAYDPVVWSECLRVLKPGGWLLAFGGSRTYHRLAGAIEDAGFEIRDMIEWLYGSGFPKSLDVSKAMDKTAGAIQTKKRLDVSQVANLKARQDSRPSIEQAKANGFHEIDDDTPICDQAKRWSGYGTALKPAHEPICVARKPLIGTVVENVLQHGTGALNIDGCRIALNGDYKCKANGRPSQTGLPDNYDPAKANQPDNVGRFPANLILDDDAARMLDDQTGELTSGQPSGIKKAHNQVFGHYKQGIPLTGFGDTGGASRFFARCNFTEEERDLNLRFFYTAKASGSDRGNTVKSALPLFGVAQEEFRNTHPTVKPVALMRYLLQLVCAPGAQVLDPFAGSGTTLLAAQSLGLSCTGIELETDHIRIIEERLNR